MREFYIADHFHALFAFLLLFKKFSFARNVAAITFGKYVLAKRVDSLARNDLTAYRSLNRDFKLLARNFIAQAFADFSRALVCVALEHKLGKRVNCLSVKEYVKFCKFRRFIA